jgi:hypothetical protein
MPLLDKAVQWSTNRMPKVINPTAHALIDYATAATFLGMAGLFWRRNKRAAIASLLCGATELLTAMLTDYPGGVAKQLSFETHGSIDFGISGLVAALPDTMRFSGEPESRFFRVQGFAIAAVTGLTDFTGTGERKQKKLVDERAA